MSKKPFVLPRLEKDGFNCPHCSAFSDQNWFDAGYGDNGWRAITGLKVAFCAHCRGYSVWLGRRMINPANLLASSAHHDMPADVQLDYDEARQIAGSSSRSAAALLRLSIQKLCKELGEPGENINADIAALVSNGLPVAAQRALDIVRVVGNEQVHPGTLHCRKPDFSAKGH